jgi:hypothetical protein
MTVTAERSWYFDDLAIGEMREFGVASISAEDLALFCERFSPHLPLNPEEPAPARAPCAQAHVYALWTRMLWDETKHWPVLARLGQDALRWYKTAHAGDTLAVRLTFVSKQPIADDRGILIAQHDVVNQAGELVMSVLTRTMIARR